MRKTKRLRATALARVIRSQGRHQRWLAAQVNLTEATMSRLVNGTATTEEETAKRIAELLSVPVDLIFELTKESETFTLKESIPA